VPVERVVDAARAWSSALMKEHLEIIRIGYFGSYANGTYAPGSDFDVLMEVATISEVRRADRAAKYLPDRFPVGMELFVYTTEELNRLRREGSGFLAAMEKKIQWLA